MTKNIVNDEEYERMNFMEQRDYRWCSVCNCFYHVESEHNCNDYVNYLQSLQDPRD